MCHKFHFKQKRNMGDNGQRRRPPLRGDKERNDTKPRMKSPEPVYNQAEYEKSHEDSMREEDRMLSLLMESCSLDFQGFGQNLGDVLDYCDTLNTPTAKRHFVLTTFAMSLEDQNFAKSAGAFYGLIHTAKLEGDTVRSVLLSAIQKELEDNDFRSGNRQRFLNAVFLLSEMYYHIRFDAEPITVLGGELLKYFRWLLTGEEKELEVLATCIIVNGLVLKKDKPASYRKLLLEIRTALVTRNFSPQSRSWLLLIVDMDNVNYDSLPEELLMCHMTMIGDEGFQKFKRVRPTIGPSPKTNNVRQTVSDKQVGLAKSPSPRRSPERLVSDRRVNNQHIPDELLAHETHERLSYEKENSYCDLQSLEDWDSSEQSSSSDRRIGPPRQRSSDEWQSSGQSSSSDRRQSFDTPHQYDSHKNVSIVSHKVNGKTKCPPWFVPNYSGRPVPGRVNKRNMDLWTEPPPPENSCHGIISSFKKDKDKRIPVWQHEHDDRFSQDYK